MKKSTKIWLGIATIWPIVYIFLFVVVVLSAVILLPHDPGPPTLGSGPPGSMLFPIGFMGLFAVHILTILGTLALTVFYIIRVFKTEQLDQNMKIMWMLLLFSWGCSPNLSFGICISGAMRPTCRKNRKWLVQVFSIR